MNERKQKLLLSYPKVMEEVVYEETMKFRTYLCLKTNAPASLT